MRRKKEENIENLMEFINNYVCENNGISPKLSEIMEYTKMSKATAYRHILELEKRGLISYRGKNTLEIKGQNKLKSSFLSVAVLGTIPCGIPEDYRENIQGYVTIPKDWINGKGYLLRATGNSMVDIGIDENDLVLIKYEINPTPGQIVVAKTERGMTLKRYMKDESGKPWLLAENKGFSDNDRYIYPSSLEVQGVALKVIKDLM